MVRAVPASQTNIKQSL